MSENIYFEYNRKEILSLIPQKYYRVLEIGCGVGNFRNNFTNECEYWGIEPVVDVANEANKHLNKVLVGTYEDTFDDLPNDYFDLIICNDVIEHMVNPDNFFQSIKLKMTSEAYIIGSIPNVRYLENIINLMIKKDWEYVDAGILDRTHLRFFTENSLKKTIIKQGYKIEKFIYINSIFSNPYTIGAIIKRVLVKILGKDTEFLQFGIRIKQVGNGV